MTIALSHYRDHPPTGLVPQKITLVWLDFFHFFHITTILSNIYIGVKTTIKIDQSFAWIQPYVDAIIHIPKVFDLTTTPFK